MKKRKYDIVFLVVCFLAIAGSPSKVLGAKPSFKSYELKSACHELLFADFDGDGLDDIIVIDEPNLVFFFQDAKRGFTKTANLVYSLADMPSVIWTAKLGKNPGQHILVMTHDGVSALTYVDKTSPLEKGKIISRQTIIPEKCETSPIIFFKLSANTAGEFPLIFVPTENDLEVWKYDSEWRHLHSLQGMPDTKIWGPHKAVGYTKQHWLNLNIGDLDGDGLEDIVICEENNEKTLFKVYPQTKEASFALKPSQSFEDDWDWRKWICLQDINKDDRVDIIKNKWLEEPWFLPGTRSGKVLVQIFMSDLQGNFPDKPAFVFRKNDWISSMPILDVDGDGFIDLVLGYNRYVDSEKIRKTLASKKLDHSLRIHFHDDGGFPKEPDCQKALTIHLYQRGLHFSWSQRGFLETQICLDGDFDGDGDKDLLVKDKPDKASVYFLISRKKGFSKKANVRFNIKHVEGFITEDLNEDGISDLIVWSSNKDSFKVFLSKRR
ncbi:MAG: FG-GAP repeat domain-containing protein [Planctomycetota bacterium]